MFNVKFVNVCVLFLSVIHAPQLLSDFFFIEYCLVLAFIPLCESVWADVTTIEFVVLVAVGGIWRNMRTLSNFFSAWQS